MSVILSARPSAFPVMLQKLVIALIVVLAGTELTLVRLSSPENMIFFRACINPEESGHLKPGQIFSKGYSLKDKTYVFVQSGTYVCHTVGLVTTLASAFWLRKQETIVANESIVRTLVILNQFGPFL